MEFKKDTIDKLKYYVYALTKPEDGQEKIFYIGKDKGAEPYYEILRNILKG